MKRVIFRSILFRYIISYAIVIIVLFVGVGIYVSKNFAKTIHESIVEENTNRLSALRMQHEEKLKSLINISNQISFSPYISPFKLKDEPMKAYHLKQQLASYNSDDFFDQLYIIFHEDNYLYSSNTSASLDLYTEMLINYEHVIPDELRLILRKQEENISILPSMNVQSVLTSGTNKKMATIVIPLRLDGRFSIGNAIFLIPDSAYQRLFSDEIEQMRNMYIFNGQEVLSATRSLDIADEVICSAISGTEKSFIHELTSNGVRYLLFVQHSSLLDLKYVSLIPEETVQMRTTRSRVGFALFILLLSIPCSLLTVYFARKHVKPIHELQQNFSENDSTEDGFTAIQSGIESLIGQNKALHTRLDESMAACRANFVKNFVKRRFETREDTVNTAANLDMDIDHSFYCVSLMSSILKDVNELGQLCALTDSRKNVNDYGMEIVDQEQYLFLLFSDSKEALISWVDTAKTVLSSLDNEAIIAVSSIHTDFAKADTAYLEASTAYDNRFVMGNENVLWFSDVSVAAKDIEPFSRTYLDGFRKALHAGNSQALNDRINELFQILKDKKFSLFAFRIIYNDIISMLLNKYFSYDDAFESDSLQYYDIFELSRCRKVADLVNTLRRLCHDVLRKEEQNAPKEQSVIRKVINYMRQHYTDPTLTMGAIADLFGISASRLSLEYKGLTGMYPSEYLLLLRMEKSKELLAKTSMSIQDVGTAVGYYDASGFIRRFKRHMSITPAQYRHSVKKRIQ